MIIQQVCFDNWPSRTQWDVHLEVMTPHWNERSVAHETFWHNILYHFNIIYIIKGNGFQTLHSRKSKLNNFITDNYHTKNSCIEPIIYFDYIYSCLQMYIDSFLCANDTYIIWSQASHLKKQNVFLKQLVNAKAKCCLKSDPKQRHPSQTISFFFFFLFFNCHTFFGFHFECIWNEIVEKGVKEIEMKVC